MKRQAELILVGNCKQCGSPIYGPQKVRADKEPILKKTCVCIANPLQLVPQPVQYIYVYPQWQWWYHPYPQPVYPNPVWINAYPNWNVGIGGANCTGISPAININPSSLTITDCTPVPNGAIGAACGMSQTTAYAKFDASIPFSTTSTASATN